MRSGYRQLVTSLAELGENLPLLTEKQIRGALTFLEESEMVEIERLKRTCSLVTIVNYEQYQGVFEAEDVPLLHGEDSRDENDPKKGRTKGQSEGQTTDDAEGRPENDDNSVCGKGKSGVGDAAGADLSGGEGRTGGRTGGQVINKVKKLKKTDPPYPPFAKGGVRADSSALLGSDADRQRMASERKRIRLMFPHAPSVTVTDMPDVASAMGGFSVLVAAAPGSSAACSPVTDAMARARWRSCLWETCRFLRSMSAWCRMFSRMWSGGCRPVCSLPCFGRQMQCVAFL